MGGAVFPISPKIFHPAAAGMVELLQRFAGCAAGIAALLRNPARMRQLSETCKTRDYTNSAEIEKIYALMED